MADYIETVKMSRNTETVSLSCMIYLPISGDLQMYKHKKSFILVSFQNCLSKFAHEMSEMLKYFGVSYNCKERESNQKFYYILHC